MTLGWHLLRFFKDKLIVLGLYFLSSGCVDIYKGQVVLFEYQLTNCSEQLRFPETVSAQELPHDLRKVELSKPCLRSAIYSYALPELRIPTEGQETLFFVGPSKDSNCTLLVGTLHKFKKNAPCTDLNSANCETAKKQTLADSDLFMADLSRQMSLTTKSPTRFHSVISDASEAHPYCAD